MTQLTPLQQLDLDFAEAARARALAAKQTPQVGVVEDVGRAAVSGLARGTMAIPGMIGDLPDVGALGVNWVQGLFGMPEKDRVDPAFFQKNAAWLPNTADIEKAVGFEAYKPQTDIGRYVNAGAEFLPSALAFGGVGGGLRSAAVNAAKYGVGGGLASEAGGDIGATLYGEGARLPGQIMGGVFGPGVASKAITPFPASAARNAAVGTLADEGVTALTAGQRTGNMPLRYWESETGGARMAQTLEQGGEQYTQAVLSRAGINANRATPEVINDAYARIGRDFEGLAARNALAPDRQMANDLKDDIGWYADRVEQPNRAPIITRYLTEVGNLVAAGPISGEAYASLRSRIRADARDLSEPYARRTLDSIGNTLDDAMERSIQANNPADLGGWQDARRQYRNMLVVERAATGAGEAANQGLITPAQLRIANQTVAGRRAVARGLTDFDELARAGGTVMTPLPQSGTAPRTAARVANAVPAAAGAMLAGKVGQGDLMLQAAGLGVGAAVPEVARAIAFSRTGRGYLANQALGGANRTPAMLGVASALNNATMPVRLPSGRAFDDVAAAIARRKAGTPIPPR